jgi:hypothetical protein
MKILLSLDTYDTTPSAHLFITYLKFVAKGVVLCLLIVISMNYLINPYSIYTAPRLDGINNNKPLLFKYLRLTKAYAVMRKKPDALILGSSRTEHGLNPEHPAMLEHYNSFNLALTGASIYENLRYLQHANAVNPLKMVVLAVDFFQFNAYRPTAADFTEQRLRSDYDGNPRPVRLFTDILETLASVDAATASIKTIFQQGNDDNVILARGQVMQPDKNTLVMRSGGRHEAALFSELNYITHLYFPRPHRKNDFVTADGSINTFDYFKRILAYCHAHNIELHLLISPAHARQWQLIASVGMWDKFEQWKQEMVRYNNKVAATFGRQTFPLWDFSGYNSYTTEPVPALGDKVNMMKWYWESSHYRTELGDRVLDKVLDYHDPDRIIADDFGVKINTENIETHLQNIRNGRADYEQKHADAVEEIKSLVKKYRSK